jgi:hypothetical protein
MKVTVDIASHPDTSRYVSHHTVRKKVNKICVPCVIVLILNFKIEKKLNYYTNITEDRCIVISASSSTRLSLFSSVLYESSRIVPQKDYHRFFPHSYQFILNKL